MSSSSGRTVPASERMMCPSTRGGSRPRPIAPANTRSPENSTSSVACSASPSANRDRSIGRARDRGRSRDRACGRGCGRPEGGARVGHVLAVATSRRWSVGGSHVSPNCCSSSSGGGAERGRGVVPHPAVVGVQQSPGRRASLASCGTPHTWSRWPWVSRIASQVTPVAASSSGPPRSAPSRRDRRRPHRRRRGRRRGSSWSATGRAADRGRTDRSRLLLSGWRPARLAVRAAGLSGRWPTAGRRGRRRRPRRPAARCATRTRGASDRRARTRSAGPRPGPCGSRPAPR